MTDGLWAEAYRNLNAQRRAEAKQNRIRECFCIGPQNGEPLCPCRMANLTVRDGRYIEVIDHGPVPERRRTLKEG